MSEVSDLVERVRAVLDEAVTAVAAEPARADLGATVVEILRQHPNGVPADDLVRVLSGAKHRRLEALARLELAGAVVTRRTVRRTVYMLRAGTAATAAPCTT